MNNELKINMKLVSSNNIDMKLEDTKPIDVNMSGGIKEIDPIFRNSPAYTITYTDIDSWNHKSNFSGNYNDLTNKPVIPTQVSQLTNDIGFITKNVNNLTNYTLTSSLASVALTGDYDDLLDKPIIPTLTSDLTNDSGYITNTVDDLTNYTLTSSLSAVAISGEYSDLLNKPSLANVATSGEYNDLLNKPTLATVANTGDYNDLLNKPSIPTKTSDLTNDSGYITNTVNDLTNYTLSTNLSTVATSGSYTDLTNTPTIPVVDSSISTSSTNAVENQAITNSLKDLIKVGSQTINVGSVNAGAVKYNQTYTLTDIPTGYKFMGILGYTLQGAGFTDFFISQLIKASDTTVTWGVKSTLNYQTSVSIEFVALYIKEI